MTENKYGKSPDKRTEVGVVYWDTILHELNDMLTIVQSLSLSHIAIATTLQAARALVREQVKS